jgi:hypothetical protein
VRENEMDTMENQADIQRMMEEHVKQFDAKLRAQGGAPLTESEKEMLPHDPDLAKLENWFTYHAPSADDAASYRLLRIGGLMLARTIVLLCPPSADRTVALRKVREVVMVANASIACGGK